MVRLQATERRVSRGARGEAQAGYNAQKTARRASAEGGAGAQRGSCQGLLVEVARCENHFCSVYATITHARNRA